MAAKSTPVMEQHARAKRAYPDAIVFFRLGDFYEMFGEDAVVAAQLLNLTLTSREKGKPNEVPMAGVPHHAAHNYIARLIEAGYQVALCEQMADPKLCKGIVPREVVRVVTPGLVTHQDYLRARENNWLGAVQVTESRVGLALLDISTGELRCAVLPNAAAALAELVHAAPREILLGSTGATDEALLGSLRLALGAPCVRSDPALDVEELQHALQGLQADAAHLDEAARWAVGRALRFARQCTPGMELPVRAIGAWTADDAMRIDANALRHLELTQSNTGNANATLLGVVDVTQSPAGARLLRRRLLAPLTRVAEIAARLDQVQSFVQAAQVRGQVREALSQVGDLERLVTRVALGEGSPKDLGGLRDGLSAAADVAAQLATLDAPARTALGVAKGLDVQAALCAQLTAALVERPPALTKEGAIFRDDFDPELARLSQLKREGSELIAALESRLREQTGISSLKARHTRVFGWYLEVSRGALGKAPKAWRRKQTIAGGERFTCDELDALAESVASAEENHRVRELALLKQLFAAVSEQAEPVRRLAEQLAVWDVSAALAEIAHRFDYVRPEVTEQPILQISEGRHPVVERLAAAGGFVPNDLSLDQTQGRFWIITGPNMAGKSTFLRQVALITILAQVGSFVPARHAIVGVVDRVLSRVGASDNLAQGESTFMVEMRETAEILRYATQRSLVILDEIGRGTSTFDGLSIAWAVAEHLDQVCRCRALFATHYHELTALAEQSPHIDNYSVSAREQGGSVVFMHRLLQGPASQSYGIAVARLAGLPEAVLGRASALLRAFEGRDTAEAETVGGEPSRLTATKPKRGNKQQLSLFAAGAPAAGGAEAPLPSSPVVAAHQDVLAEVRRVDIDHLSPLQALQLLASLKAKL